MMNFLDKLRFWRKPAPEPVLATAPAPVAPTLAVGINLPPSSLTKQIRHVSRAQRLLRAINKANAEGNVEAVDALEAELEMIQRQLYAVDIDAPADGAKLNEILLNLNARYRAGER